MEDLSGQVGRVTCTIPADGLGEVMLRVRGGSEAFSASSEDNTPIRTNARVLVVDHPSPRTIVVVPYHES